jgi:hypothetical protein
MWLRVSVGLALVLALGCGSRKYAPVSGQVTLNGQPLANATVGFQPIAAEGSMEAGPGSAGTTDEKGMFVLKGLKGESGAWVGEHRVIISLVNTKAGADDRRRGGPPQEETIPARYNTSTELTFAVRPGTNKADFNLTSP